MLAEGEETNVPVVQARTRASDVQQSLSPKQQLDAGTKLQ